MGRRYRLDSRPPKIRSVSVIRDLPRVLHRSRYRHWSVHLVFERHPHSSRPVLPRSQSLGDAINRQFARNIRGIHLLAVLSSPRFLLGPARKRADIWKHFPRRLLGDFYSSSVLVEERKTHGRQTCELPDREQWRLL